MAENQPELPRSIGLVMTDDLRIQGLEALLEDRYTLVSLTTPRAHDLAEIALVLLDAGATHHALELIGTFRRARPQIRIIVFDRETDEEHIERVIGAGARGYLPYGCRAEELEMAIAVVLEGSVWAPRKVMARLLQKAEAGEPKANIPVAFTNRETQVLRHLVLGRSNREIATLLEVDEAAIKAHLGRCMRKMGVQNRTALSMKMLTEGWLPPAVDYP